MIIAKEKRKNNVAEYILYMWQLEDMIRAYNYDFEKINEHIISQFDVPDSDKHDIRSWYNDMINAMESEGIKEKGHLLHINALVQELSEFNINLLQKDTDKKYIEAFNAALPHISEIINKSNGSIKNEIEACLVGMYGLLLMRLKKTTISEDTEKALKTFSNFLAILSFRFKEMEEGKLEI